MYWVYILSSLKTGMFYIGSTSNLKERLYRHNGGRSRFTKDKGPWKIVYSEQFGDKAIALKREFEIKGWKSRKAIEKLISHGLVV